MKAIVHVSTRAGVLDPEAKAIGKALQHSGFTGVQDVKQGRYFEITMDGTSPEAARAMVEEMCQSLLANPVIQDYRIEFSD